MKLKILGSALVIILVAVGLIYWSPFVERRVAEDTLTINEAARTLLYLPLYHAENRGYFADEHLQVKIVTGGSAATSVAAIVSGAADLAQADPMYAPISQANGSDVVVVGQIAGRIGLWALARPGTNLPFNEDGLRGTPVITHPKPMTSYAYTELLLQGYGIPEKEARFVEAKPGTEIATFRAETRAPFIVTVEPAVSVLEGQGAKVVYSWPQHLGDRVFTGLLVRRSDLNEEPEMYTRALRAYQRALNDIAARDPTVVETAKKYFPNLQESELSRALERLTNESVFPRTLVIPETSWASAVEARRQIGDLKGPAAFNANVADKFTRDALAHK